MCVCSSLSLTVGINQKRTHLILAVRVKAAEHSVTDQFWITQSHVEDKLSEFPEMIGHYLETNLFHLSLFSLCS